MWKLFQSQKVASTPIHLYRSWWKQLELARHNLLKLISILQWKTLFFRKFSPNVPIVQKHKIYFTHSISTWKADKRMEKHKVCELWTMFLLPCIMPCLSRNISFQVLQVAFPILLSFCQFNKAYVKRKKSFLTLNTHYQVKKRGWKKVSDGKTHKKEGNQNSATFFFYIIFADSTTQKPLSIYSVICQHLFHHFRLSLVIHMSQHKRRFSIFYKKKKICKYS